MNLDNLHKHFSFAAIYFGYLWELLIIMLWNVHKLQHKLKHLLVRVNKKKTYKILSGTDFVFISHWFNNVEVFCCCSSLITPIKKRSNLLIDKRCHNYLIEFTTCNFLCSFVSYTTLKLCKI